MITGSFGVIKPCKHSFVKFKSILRWLKLENADNRTNTPSNSRILDFTLPVVHLKDYVGGKSDNMYELIGIESDGKTADTKAFEFRPVGYGCQKFEGIFEAAKNSGASWVIVEQDSPSMGLSPIECAEKSINYVKSINK